MTKYVRGKDGKFAGSIGDGKTNLPTAAPATPFPARYKEPAATTAIDYYQQMMDARSTPVEWSEVTEGEWTSQTASIDGNNAIVIVTPHTGTAMNWWLVSLHTVDDHGTLSERPVDEETFGYEEDARQWANDQLRTRYEEWRGFEILHNTDSERATITRRNLIREAGNAWDAQDTSKRKGYPAAKFAFGDRVTTLTLRNGIYRVVVKTDTTALSNDEMITLHDRTFTDRRTAVAFAHDITLLG
jgi:hypothetical protein